MAVTIEQILEHIKNLSLKEALIYTASQGIIDFSKAGYEKIKHFFVDKFNEGKYAFVPDKEEALFLQESKNNPHYKQIEELVPNYKYLDLIRTGFLVASYNKKINDEINPEKYRQRISQIKEQIAKRPGGGRLLKIVKFPTTIYFSSAITYLQNLKLNNYPIELLEDEFEELVEDWEKSSKFVKNTENFEGVISFCKRQAEQKNRRFSILGMHIKTVKIIEEAINQLVEESFFKDNNYKLKVSKSGEDSNILTMEAIVYKDILE